MKNKIILYYCFTSLSDPEAIKQWQKSVCDALNLKGRILISEHGINGTLGGDIDNLKKYIKTNKTYLPFKRIQYKWSEGGSQDFPRLAVKVRDEIVAFKAVDEIKVNENGLVGGGEHIKPEAIEKLIKDKGEDNVIFFDGRNKYEAQIGKFKNAVVPDVRTTKDFIPELESGKYDDIKNKTVITYCTGGVRCEILSVLMKNRGFKDVYQMDGGIVKYGEKFKDDGLWDGSLYIFDNRMTQKFSEKSEDIGICIHCEGKTSNFENCANVSCNDLVLICEECTKDKSRLYHSENCLKLAVV